MRTIRLLLMGLIVAHVGAAFVQLHQSYTEGDVQTYGLDGWLADTPLSSNEKLKEEVDLEADEVDAREVNKVNVPAMFSLVFDLGDIVNSTAVFNYDFLGEISEDNFFYILVLGLRLASVAVWLTVAGALIRMVLQSGLLSSQVGLVVLFGSVGILSLLGIAF